MQLQNKVEESANNYLSVCRSVKRASRQIAQLNEQQKNSLLESMCLQLEKNKAKLIEANEVDLKNAQDTGISEAMLDRLLVSPHYIAQMQSALKQVVALSDPLEAKSQVTTRPNGIEVRKQKIPLGVILMIYESRPNVTVEAAALAIKSGNAIILRGGKEAFNSNQAIASCWNQALKENGISEDVVYVFESTDREILDGMLRLDELIDVVIPRGGEGLIKYVVRNSHIPVIKHYKGVCHLYVDEHADLDKAINILLNGKTQRPGVCNALEGLLVHSSIADKFIPQALSQLRNKGVKIYGCEKTLNTFDDCKLASAKEFSAEFLSLEISCKVVESFDDAIDFIDEFGSGHTEVIITEDQQRAEQFIKIVDASVVMVNASSRFSDGGELGLGAEIGISTSKLHAYGPMGLESLTSEKFVVVGNGQIRN
ncbi:MAG: glutamate-5-semialdehyde dehydrogenase [Kangiellaceae bacterium]|nr:glutamate-5-semialdehyde dehydrogenase [Kangiellaceae bacterium]MCW8998725.1 glutamate-5-semialdehyde dehydrogenase [Kangiellaceae bacterium]MCW9017984.1 glutamate-5-semialdehyde dehydrogenase [Kangiellaceae bacterium]